MNTHADKTLENKSQTVANRLPKLQSKSESTFQFVDNRPEAIAQRKLQEAISNSPRVQQLKAYQEMANNSPQVSQLRAIQDRANNSPQFSKTAQLQAMADNHSAQQQQPIQKKKNNTGLPDNLKTGMENLSGLSLDDVNVHRNSDKPAQLQAHAYAQGTNIHLGPGQEKHLPHEAWHVVQQKQGRVKPTMQMKGKVNVNDDAGLEKEADMMGAKATFQLVPKTNDSIPLDTQKQTIQRMVVRLDTSKHGTDVAIDASMESDPKRAFAKDMLRSSNVIQNDPDEHFAIVLDRANADFSTMMDSYEPIILVAHAGEEYDTRPKVAKEMSDMTAVQLGDWLISKGLPLSYRGMIYADGCNTGTGPEIGVKKGFIDRLADHLHKKGYIYVSVKGNLGFASSGAGGGANIKSPMIRNKTENLQKIMEKVAPMKDWGLRNIIFDVEKELENALANGEDSMKLTRQLDTLGDKATREKIKNDIKWTNENEKIFKEYSQLSKERSIADFVRVRGPRGPEVPK